MRIEQVSKTETDKYKHTQKRSLKILLTNASPQERSGLTVRYYFFGKGVGDNDIIVMDKGEKAGERRIEQDRSNRNSRRYENRS
jgi:hypothetical protein